MVYVALAFLDSARAGSPPRIVAVVVVIRVAEGTSPVAFTATGVQGSVERKPFGHAFVSPMSSKFLTKSLTAREEA